jgi:hypothetical protein
VFSLDQIGMSFRRRCLQVMDRSAHYRDLANHARQLADATWQPNLEDLLRHLAKDYDEIAGDIETGAIEIRHAEFPDL